MKNVDVKAGDGERERIRAVMDKVRQIEIRTRHLVDDTVAGHYRAVFRGRGLDFDSVREYVPGDEVRAIDWNVTARAGRPFVKQFREERELTIWILVDVSGSGEFGSGATTKREVAAEIACVLALSAVRNDDKVGLIMFSDQIEVQVSPAKGRAHVMRLVREILTCRPRGRGTDIAGAVELAGRLAVRRSVMFLVSDLELPADGGRALAAIERAARPVAARHDVIAVEVRDPHERALPNLGLVTVEDAETGDVMTLDTGRRRVRERFAALAEKRDADTRRSFARLGVETLPLDTATPYLPVLLGFFERRERRLG
ncbi:MAG TPA: DUF58 domain-containing protein [Polyangia bacterium]|jgi:uncharacterized protein (DUF58 family)|nr:DUF58 domain-containing protein [Polyangia bacterium]